MVNKADDYLSLYLSLCDLYQSLNTKKTEKLMFLRRVQVVDFIEQVGCGGVGFEPTTFRL